MTAPALAPDLPGDRCPTCRRPYDFAPVVVGGIRIGRYRAVHAPGPCVPIAARRLVLVNGRETAAGRCVECDTPFTAVLSGGKLRLTCSDPCARARAQRQKKTSGQRRRRERQNRAYWQNKAARREATTNAERLCACGCGQPIETGRLQHAKYRLACGRAVEKAANAARDRGRGRAAERVEVQHTLDLGAVG